MTRSTRPDRTVLVTASVLLALLLPTLPASAAAPAAESWPVPDQATIALDGRGFGHGKGLSQYGALGRGRAGHGYRDIVEFYYPKTEWGSAGGSVKVLITGDTSDDVVVGARRGLTLRALATGKRWKLPETVRKNRSSRKTVPVKRWRISPASRGRSAVSYRTRGWHDWRAFRGEAEFAASGKPVALRTPDGVVEYRGTLRSATPSGAPSQRDTVNVVKLDAYLKGVVPSEVIASVWPAETIKAQAVAARTYAAYERDHAPSARHYQLCDTARCQVYGGYSAEYSTSNDAVRATAHQVLTHAGEPGVRPVLRQQRWLQRARLVRVPRGAARPVRPLRPGPRRCRRLGDRGRLRRHRGRLQHREPDRDQPSPPGTTVPRAAAGSGRSA